MTYRNAIFLMISFPHYWLPEMSGGKMGFITQSWQAYKVRVFVTRIPISDAYQRRVQCVHSWERFPFNIELRIYWSGTKRLVAKAYIPEWQSGSVVFWLSAFREHIPCWFAFQRSVINHMHILENSGPCSSDSDRPEYELKMNLIYPVYTKRLHIAEDL